MSSQLDSLIRMVNQIAANNTHRGDTAAEYVHIHLKKFWARSMKRQIITYLQQDGSELLPLARQAVELLAQEQPVPAE
ncbi:MAG TPA: formate dehydrogenase subunit delta [Candidatus Halomonas stercoripullorum]|uniref:Formate dehydrogenase subunit delta n=1 Tax=Candidatus Halomonas stercoripullorum TaxID=2838617 RepID=A0A9D2B4H9_9GAMM|nr:formate dehydrogenase subunit delta [Candidatus Halomonas stercoripullorum]